MTKIKQLRDKTTNEPIVPITHPDAIVGNNGNSLNEILESFKQETIAGVDDKITSKVDKASIKQETGNDTNSLMSQDAITKELNTKIIGGTIKQELGDSKTDVISQKGILNILSKSEVEKFDAIENVQRITNASLGADTKCEVVYCTNVNSQYKNKFVFKGIDESYKDNYYSGHKLLSPLYNDANNNTIQQNKLYLCNGDIFYYDAMSKGLKNYSLDLETKISELRGEFKVETFDAIETVSKTITDATLNFTIKCEIIYNLNGGDFKNRFVFKGLEGAYKNNYYSKHAKYTPLYNDVLKGTVNQNKIFLCKENLYIYDEITGGIKSYLENTNNDIVSARTNHIDCIPENTDAKYKIALIGIKDLKIYVPDITQEYSLAFLGYVESSTKYFVIGVFNDTTGERFYKIKYYDIKPISGIETISLITDGYIFEATVDWSVINKRNYLSLAKGQVPIYPLSANNQISYGIPFFKYIPDNCKIILDCCKDVEFYLPDRIKAKDCTLRFMKYNISVNKFFFGIYYTDEITGNRTDVYGESKVYPTRPTEGIEKIIFSIVTNQMNDTYMSVTIDWSKYSESISSLPLSSVEVNPSYISKFNGIVRSINSNLGNLYGVKKLIGNFELSSIIRTSKNQIIEGDNCSIHCLKGGRIDTSNITTIKNIRFYGDWPDRKTDGSRWIAIVTMEELSQGSTATMYGEGVNEEDCVVHIDTFGAYNTLLENCIFEHINRNCVWISGTSHQGKENAIMTSCEFNECRMGVYVANSFTRIIGNMFHACVIGVCSDSGNINFNGNFCKQCDCGYYYPIGTNGGHGQHTGNEIAHCSVVGIYAKQIARNTGDNWTGCQIVDAPIVCEEAHNLMFVGCRIDGYIEIQNGDKNSVMANNIGNSYTRGKPSYKVPLDTYIVNNIGIASMTNEQANNK